MKKLLVVGNKTSQSLSPIIFNYWFKKYKINANYSFLELNNKNFEKKIKDVLKDERLCGFNVTIPFKQKIMKNINVLDKHTKKINAVNCVSIKPKIKGFNTDWQGYYKTIPNREKLKNKKTLLIGYGGAALAIHYVLTSKGFKNITILNRSKKKIRFEKKTTYTKKIEEIEKYLQDADFIINTIPKNPISKKNKKLINPKTILSDIIYSPKETKFLKSFPKNKKIYGISMLLEQAVISFKIWFGFTPKIDKEILKILEKRIK